MISFRNLCATLALATTIAVLNGQAFAQNSSSAASTAFSQPPRSASTQYAVVEPAYRGPFSTVGVAVHASTLGIGFDVATPIASRLNLRGTADFFRLNTDFDEDGIQYNAGLNLSSGQVTLDWFLFSGFHISPGVLLAKNHMDATLNVPGGQKFSLGDEDYTSKSTDPVHGSAGLTFPHTASPELKFGFGNIIPRSGRHWSVPVELGAAYVGHPTMALSFAGTGCQGPNSTDCGNLATDPDAQKDIRQETTDLNEDLKRASVYPIFSIGVSYKF